MVKVKVIKRYNDVVLKRIQEEGTVFETNEKRADYLVHEGVVELVKEESAKARKTVKDDGKE